MGAFPTFFLWTLIILSQGLTVNQQPDDYQIIITEAGFTKLAKHLTPRLADELKSTAVPAQTVETDVTLDIDEITVKNISLGNIIIHLQESTQTISLNLIDLNLEINRFKFVASKDVLFVTPSCTGYLTPEFSNWNLSVTFNPATNNCTVSIQLNESATVVQEGAINLNKELESIACNTLYGAADLIVGNIEQLIEQQIIDQIPILINTELQEAINQYLEDNANDMGAIKICYQNLTIYGQSLLIAGDLIIPKPLPQAPGEFTTTPVDLEIPDIDDGSDDASLFVFGICMFVLACLVGAAGGIGLFCGCNKAKIQALKEYQALEHEEHGVGVEMDDEHDLSDGSHDDDEINGGTANAHS